MSIEQKNLINRFFLSLNKNEDINGFFTEDGFIEETSSEKILYKGKEIDKWIEKQKKLHCLHLCLNDFYQDIDENKALHTGNIQVIAGNSIISLYTCSDTIIKEKGVWKFSERKFLIKEINKDKLEMHLKGLDKEDFKKLKKIERKPKRIFVMRTGESEAAGNRKIYANTPDHKLKLTENGKKQALEAGKKLREIIKDESVFFYLSPFTRAKETFEYVSKSWKEGSYRFKEDPRLREQEWGNYQGMLKLC